VLGETIKDFDRLLDRLRDASRRINFDWGAAKGLLREALLLLLALGVYYGVRVLVRDSGAQPFVNAALLVRFESVLHLNWEIALQRAFMVHVDPVVHLLNFVYAWGYWLILGGTLGYLYVWRRDLYRNLRNAIIVSGLIGFFVFASFPVAPPRLASVGIVDTSQLGGSILEQVTRPSTLTNEMAAMPSFHFGWVLLCSTCLSMALRRRISKALVALIPLLMGLTIIVTGNHYVVDAFVGGAICLLVLVPFAFPRRVQPELA
jgi:hypothetical protein